MNLEKMLRSEIILTVASAVLVICVFVGVSYASFIKEEEGEKTEITYGNIGLEFCASSGCESTIENIGQVIGTEKIDGVTYARAMYPESEEEALLRAPYIFKIRNTGTLKETVTIYLEEDEEFIPVSEYSNYNEIMETHKEYIKVSFGGDEYSQYVKSYSELEENKIGEEIELQPGESRIYSLWTWVSNETVNEIQGTYFVANIRIESEYLPALTLKDKIIENSGIKEGVPNFSQTSSEEDTGLYKAEDDYGTSYYFRGNKGLLNNNVIFDNKQWKIIMITGNGDTKIIYNGECPNNECTIDTVVGDETQIGTSAFNTTNNNAKYMGYTYDANVNSTVKTYIDTWYTNNMSANAKTKISDTIYCNDRTSTVEVIGNNTYTYYGAYYRLWENKIPSLKCPQKADAYTVDDEVKGNGILTNPVALITADEVSMAGSGVVPLTNPDYYLYTYRQNWTMTPLYFNYNQISYVFMINKPGEVNSGNVDLLLGVRPVIAIKSEVEISSGNGSSETPYIISE